MSNSGEHDAPSPPPHSPLLTSFEELDSLVESATKLYGLTAACPCSTFRDLMKNKPPAAHENEEDVDIWMKTSSSSSDEEYEYEQEEA
jgi:hypothetical protein